MLCITIQANKNESAVSSFLPSPGVACQSLKSCLVLLLSPHDNSSFNAILIYQGNLGLATTPQPAKPTPTRCRPLKINPQCLPSPPPLFFLQPDPHFPSQSREPPRSGRGHDEEGYLVQAQAQTHADDQGSGTDGNERGINE